ncbi:MAG: SIMPL domain-containing protein [Coleofasciculaceae cyanobacterium SM2_1_6]|nr:SIMPL domain-containing protein [Coleofasciculaceae cyanobacterium SM2_1_6]
MEQGNDQELNLQNLQIEPQKLHKLQKLQKSQKLQGLSRFLPLVLGILSIGLADPVAAQERMLRTLSVSGRGVETIAATIARVDLGVEFQGKNASEVQQEVASRSNAVVNLLRTQNVENLQTRGIRLEPVYNYANDRQELIGYRGTNKLSFRVAPDRAGQIVDGAVQAGATRIEGINFTASDAAIDQAQQQALRLATQDAQKQADTVLSSLNLTRREIVNIQVNGATPPPPIFLRAASEAFAQGAPTPVIPGDQRVEASVTLTISY